MLDAGRLPRGFGMKLKQQGIGGRTPYHATWLRMMHSTEGKEVIKVWVIKWKGYLNKERRKR
jgi:hypothetical protein